MKDKRDILLEFCSNPDAVLNELHRQGWQIIPAHASEQGVIMREFVGWISADIPELHKVEVPRLAESLERFLSQRPTPATEETKKEPYSWITNPPPSPRT